MVTTILGATGSCMKEGLRIIWCGLPCVSPLHACVQGLWKDVLIIAFELVSDVAGLLSFVFLFFFFFSIHLET